MSANIPQYELLADHFFEPEMVGKGSVIEFDGVPNEKMKPLNEEATAALEAWFAEKFDLLDDKTGLPMRDHEGKFMTHQPRMQFRPRPVEEGRRAGVKVLSSPDATQPIDASKTLAGIQNAPAKEWERPGPIEGLKVVKAEPANATTKDGAPITATVKV